MRLQTITLALAGALASPVTFVDLTRRQLPCADIASYFRLVNTALFAVNYVNSFSHPCDTSLIPYFDSQGLNGRYAVDIICLYDAGVKLFDEPLEVVNDNLIVTLIGLFDAFGSITDPSRNLSCANINANILEELELDSAVIRDIVCDYSPCTTGVPVSSSTSSCPTGSISTVSPSRSASSTVPPGTSVSSTGSSRPPCTGSPPGTGSSSVSRTSSASSSSDTGSSSAGSITSSSTTGYVTSSSSTGYGTSSSGSSGSLSSSSIPVYPPPMTYY